MRFFILFISLFLLSIVNVNAQETCEQHFSVPACSECQLVAFNTMHSPSSCGFFSRLFGTLKFGPYGSSYDLKTYSDAVTTACSAEFSCTFEEVNKFLTDVQAKCATELTTKLDWSADPSTVNHAAISPYGAVMITYSSIPEHDSLCHKGSSGELCAITCVRPIIDWIKKEAPQGAVRVSFDHQFLYKEDGTRVKIPEELFSCGECSDNAIKVFNTWVDEHAVPDPIIKNVFESVDGYKGYFKCPVLI